MAARSLIGNHVRTLDMSVEGASIYCAARPWLANTKHCTRSISRLRRPWVPSTSNSTSNFASIRTNASSRRQSPTITVHAPPLLADELGKATSVVNSEALPSEGAVQHAMEICKNLSKSLTEPTSSSEAAVKPAKGPTSNLLSLEQESGGMSKPSPSKTEHPKPIKPKLADAISLTAYKIMTDPKVYITSKLLSTYVDTQANLGRPESFPEIFHLYGSKPVPRPGTFPIKYKKPNPDHPASAIPLPIAHKALTAAIEAKELQLCMDIVDVTVCTKAHLRRRCLRYLSLPGLAAALSPLAVYEISSRIADWQQSMDRSTAIGFCFTAIMAYVYFTSLIGWAAIGSYNDHHDRITWQVGTQLRFRWVREDERAMVDRIAIAWGFKDKKKRGEEEGEEWEWLREWAGRRAMILDAAELMEGME